MCMVKRSGKDHLEMNPDYCNSVDLRLNCPCAWPAGPYRWALYEDWEFRKLEEFEKEKSRKETRCKVGIL